MRLLKAEEIDIRVAQVQTYNGTSKASLLAYKDARCDMNILDEEFGANNWKRSHEVIGGNLFCTVSIWDEKLQQWIEKQDVGTESMTEKEKGQASDAFKRACFNWGIGRELYSAPRITITLRPEEVAKNKQGKETTYARFYVREIEYNERRKISYISIVDSKGNVRFTYGDSRKPFYMSLLGKIMKEKGITGVEAQDLSYKLFNQSESKKLELQEIIQLIEWIEVNK